MAARPAWSAYTQDDLDFVNSILSDEDLALCGYERATLLNNASDFCGDTMARCVPRNATQGGVPSIASYAMRKRKAIDDDDDPDWNS